MDDSLLFAASWLPLAAAVLAAAIVQAAARHWQRTLAGQEGLLPRCGLAGHLVARRLLDACGLPKVSIQRTDDRDRYDSLQREVELSSQHYDGASVAALAVAAHEVGHAEQFATGFLACRLKKLIGPVCFLLAGGCAVLAVAGIGALSMPQLGLVIGVVGVISLSLQLAIVLPLELDASRRARRLVQQESLIAPEEQAGFDRLLQAAALTYVAVEARRWIFLVAAIVALMCIGDQLTGEAPEINLDLAEVAEDAAPLDVLSLFLADGGRIVFLGAMCLLLWRFKSPGKSSPAQRSAERNNVGLALYERGETQAAIAAFDDALRLDPQSATALFNRALARVELGQLDAALADLNASLDFNPGFVPALARRGDVWLLRGDDDRALAEYNAALTLDPANTLALVGRGHLLLRRQNDAAALADFERAIAVSPSDPTGHAGRGAVWFVRQDLPRALADFNAAFTLGYGDADTHVLCGQICLVLEDYVHSIGHLTAALEQQPRQAAVWRDRGLAWLRQGELERALADLDEAIRLNPADAVSFNNRGVVRMKSGDHLQARADLEQALRLDPALPNPRQHLASLAS